MVVELSLLIEPFKVRQSQDDDLSGMPLCPVIDHLENTLVTVAEWYVFIQLVYFL